MNEGQGSPGGAVENPRIVFAMLGAAVVLCVALFLGPALLPEPKRTGAAAGSVAMPAVIPFSMTERSGRVVGLRDLKGTVWVANFIFTRCQGPCPLMTARMRQIQDVLAGTGARLVTFTVDPEFDTPEVLAAYAEKAGADPERWWFLTGPRAEVFALANKGFLLPVGEAPPEMIAAHGPVLHSTRLAVVDQAGIVRHYVDGVEDHAVRSTAAYVRQLAGPTP